MVKLSHPYITTEKPQLWLDRPWSAKWRLWLFKTLYRFDIAILPKSKSHLILWLQSLSAVFWSPRKWNLTLFSTYPPLICHEVMELDAMIFVFWMLSFKPAFSLSFFTFIKRLLSSSSFSAIKVVSSAYLRLLIFFPAILIPPCDSSSPAFHMYSTYKLNEQGDDIQPWYTPFPYLN